MPYCHFCQQPVAKLAGSCPHCKAYLGDEASWQERVGEEGSAAPPSYKPHSLEQRVFDLLEQQRMLEAIKLYKDETGVDLWEAKEAVEAIGRGQPPESLGGASTAPPAAPTDAALQQEVVELLHAGAGLEAVKRYRDRTGASLKQSKDAVDAIALRHGLRPTSSGCGAALIALLLVGVFAAVVAGAIVLFSGLLSR